MPFHFTFAINTVPGKGTGAFVLPKRKENLVEGDYFVDIDVEFLDEPMVQLEMIKEGETDKRILFVGHFDHPAMINDGLAGCIAANEVIRRLAGRKTRFTYVSLNAVEIVEAPLIAPLRRKRSRRPRKLFSSL